MAVRLTPALAVVWVAELLAGRTGTLWVGIDGLGAAGKTTLAGAIAAALPGAVVVGVDDFARPGVTTWDHDLFRRDVLEPVLQGRPGSYRRWDLVTERAGGLVVVPVGVPIVVEGVSATDPGLDVPWDVRLWVDASESVRRARIRRRDPPELLARWEQDWWPAEERYLRTEHPDWWADAVVVGG